MLVSTDDGLAGVRVRSSYKIRQSRRPWLRELLVSNVRLPPLFPGSSWGWDGKVWVFPRAVLVALLAMASTRLAKILGGGPPSLFWPTNGVVILFLNSSATVLDFALTAVAGMVGLAVSQFDCIPPGIAFQLALASGLQFVLTSLAMRMLGSSEPSIAEAITTMRYLLVFVLGIQIVTGGIGAAVGALVLYNSYPGLIYMDQWRDWFIGDLVGNFIVLYIGAVVAVNSTRTQLVGVLRTRAGLQHTVLFLACSMVLVAIYSLEGLTPALAVPLLLVGTLALGSIALAVPQVMSAALSLVLVLATVICTRSGRGPLFALLGGTCHDQNEHDIVLSTQGTLLLTTVLTATLALARQKQIGTAKRAKDASDEKLAFFTHVSHEFRTPLSVVIGYTEDLLENWTADPNTHADLEQVHTAAISMSAMVEDLLSLFRLETHGIVLNSRLVPTEDFFAKILSFATRLSSNKMHVIALDARLPPMVWFDPTRVRQVLMNLVSNAIKFTPHGGTITISARMKLVDGTASFDEHSLNSGASISTGGRYNESLSVVLPREEADFDNRNDTTGQRRHVSYFGDGTVHGGSRMTSNDSNPASPSFTLSASVKSYTAVLSPSHDGVTKPVKTKNANGNNVGGGHVGRSVRPPSIANNELNVSGAAALGNHGLSFEREKRALTDNDNIENHYFLALSVKDTGHGISSEDMPRLFERFFRCDRTGTDGTGLGLTICDNIAKAMGGQLTVESTLGVGTTVTMTIPVAEIVDEESQQPRTASPTPSSMLNKATRVELNADTQEKAEPGAQAPAGVTMTEVKPLFASRQTAAVPPTTDVEGMTVGGRAASDEAWGRVDYGHGADNGGGSGGQEEEEPFRLRILLAEDSIANQKLMVRILQRAGHTVEAVEDGQEALNALASGCFDLLVLDLGLPTKSGMQVLTELRTMAPGSPLKDIPVVVSSGHVLDEHRRRCLEAGCNAFTEKPFRAKFIEETIQAVMKEAMRAGRNADITPTDVDQESGSRPDAI